MNGVRAGGEAFDIVSSTGRIGYTRAFRSFISGAEARNSEMPDVVGFFLLLLLFGRHSPLRNRTQLKLFISAGSIYSAETATGERTRTFRGN